MKDHFAATQVVVDAKIRTKTARYTNQPLLYFNCKDTKDNVCILEGRGLYRELGDERKEHGRSTWTNQELSPDHPSDLPKFTCLVQYE